jgi:hypothetical protein
VTSISNIKIGKMFTWNNSLHFEWILINKVKFSKRNKNQSHFWWLVSRGEKIEQENKSCFDSNVVKSINEGMMNGIYYIKEVEMDLMQKIFIAYVIIRVQQ